MASDVSVGDVETPTLVVLPYDGTTAATLTATAPDGTETAVAATLSATVADVGQTWTADPVTYDAAGRWLLTWTVTGTGQGTETQEVYVVASPTAGGPTWTPGRSRVANYVPGRTLSTSADTHELTFTSSTRPTGLMVDRLIADAVSWVAVAAGTINATLHEQASVAAAIWAAAAVERGYPEQDQPDASLRRATDLQGIAERIRADLIRANTAAEGSNPTDPAGAVLPIWAFPDPVAHGDWLL